MNALPRRGLCVRWVWYAWNGVGIDGEVRDAVAGARLNISCCLANMRLADALLARGGTVPAVLISS